MHSQPNVKLLSILDLCAVFFLFLAIGTSSFANATEAGGTTIDAVPPRQPSVFHGNAWSIYLDGIIDQTTANKVEQLIISQNIPHLSTIFFNSPGGSLYGGMELGRIIRKYRLVTSVGSKPIVNDSASLNKQIGATCFSACALAYLGGVFRNMDDKSRYGVHRFYIKEDIYLSADMAQIISGEIVSYLRSMDIDTDLFNLSTRAGAQDIFQPGLQMLKKLNVVNNGFTKPTWSLETTNGMLYLKGERDSIYGINKFLILCANKTPFLYIIFDAQRREDELMKMPSHSLLLDGKPTRVELASRKTIENGWFNVMFKLTSTTIKALSAAQTVGFAVQGSSTAGIFLGYDGIPFGDGRSKFLGLINNCKP